MKINFSFLRSLDFWVFIVSLAALHGVSFHVMDVTTATDNVDCVTYLGLAEFDFDQYVVRKYRILVPFIASGLDFLFGGIFDYLAPWTFNGDFSMGMSFLIVNNLLFALAGVFVFRYLYNSTGQMFASFVGLISVLTCRWTGYLAGLPLVDSLYFLVLVMVLLGLRNRNSRLILWAIFLGPWAKESFIFIAPIIFFYAPIKKEKQILYFFISGILVFASRLLIDYNSGASTFAALEEDFDHFNNIAVSLERLFSFHGVYELFSVTGFWVLLLIPALLSKTLKSHLLSLHGFEWWYVFSILLQAVISTDLARMLFLLTPVLALLWGRIVSDYFNGDLQFVTQERKKYE
ncbi:hypothetical protein [Marinilabilia rubra]|uniref:DUF2029 domain-containing protein n=1 Tax=Marinilabilia rubra TaxID=2162893 RepID=A0A2U2BCJ0_9BACT|nr:hypothetical protein [Marinilabilia rubra]PWE00782.1 hypothetical protein DDZ16_04095 [Marinilabilia rubra]